MWAQLQESRVLNISAHSRMGQAEYSGLYLLKFVELAEETPILKLECKYMLRYWVLRSMRTINRTC